MKTSNRKNKIQTSAVAETKLSGSAFSWVIVCFLGLSLFFSAVLIAMKLKEPYPDWVIYLQYLLPIFALAIASAWYYKNLQKTPAELLRKQQCPVKYYIIAILLQIGLFSLSHLNTIFLAWLEKFGYQPQSILLPSLDGFGVVGVIFTVAVLPAVFEEIFFRGVLLDGSKTFGNIGAALVCGGIFALYHQNPAQTLYQFCCGFAFALVALRAGSVLPTIISHCVNNALIILLTKFGVDTFPVLVNTIVLCVSVPCLIVSLGYLLFVDKRKEDEPTGTKKEFALGAAVGLAICAVTWVSALFVG